MLETRDLTCTIAESKILRGITCTIKEGETVGIIGPNGSGKTTFFNCLSGFHASTSGQIFLRDKNITDMPPYERASMGIGRVFQNFGIFREMTVLENMITAIEGRESYIDILLPWSGAHKRVRESSMHFLKEVNLEGKAKEKASSLSGGQMRLLEIARSLAFGADVFLLDEPTAGVSPKMKDEVAQLIIKLQESKKTVLIIEHDIAFIQKFCSRIIVLDAGQVVLDGLPAEVRENPMLQEIYFGKTA